MVICVEQGADLHMAQLMPLPLTLSCFSKIEIGFTFLLPAHPGSPGKRAVKWVCVCVFYMPWCAVLTGACVVMSDILCTRRSVAINSDARSDTCYRPETGSAAWWPNVWPALVWSWRLAVLSLSLSVCVCVCVCVQSLSHPADLFWCVCKLSVLLIYSRWELCYLSSFYCTLVSQAKFKKWRRTWEKIRET